VIRDDGPVASHPADITAVAGGPVVTATYAELDDLARRFAAAGVRILSWSLLPTEALVEPALLASAALAPLSFARVEESLLATLAGRDALPTVAAEWEALGIVTGAARAAIESIDSGEVARLWLDAEEVVGLAAPGLTPSDRTTLALGGAAALLTTGLGTTAVGLASGVASELYGPETGVRTVAVPFEVPSGACAPRDVTSLATHLTELSVLSDRFHPENDGTIEIQTLVAADGSRRHVVYLPGTDDMNPLSSDGQLRDMQENLRLIAGRDTDYARGVLTAMAQAGVRPGEPVLLTGHSQGGMVAAALAAHHSPYDVTNVVTFGAPTAQVHRYPPGVRVLSLEHRGDLVPQLAGPDAPSADVVTVQFDSGIEGLVGNHSFEHYTRGAEAVDASTDPDVAAARAALSGFFTAGWDVRSQVFQLTRER
jgi:hypothetical protein